MAAQVLYRENPVIRIAQQHIDAVHGDLAPLALGGVDDDRSAFGHFQRLGFIDQFRNPVLTITNHDCNRQCHTALTGGTNCCTR